MTHYLNCLYPMNHFQTGRFWPNPNSGAAPLVNKKGSVSLKSGDNHSTGFPWNNSCVLTGSIYKSIRIISAQLWVTVQNYYSFNYVIYIVGVTFLSWTLNIRPSNPVFLHRRTCLTLGNLTQTGKFRSIGKPQRSLITCGEDSEKW